MLLAERFGSNVTLDLTTPTAPKLVINLKDLENTPNGNIINGVGLDDTTLITNQTKDDYSDKIFAAIFLLNIQKQPATNTIADNGVWITSTPTRAFITRANVPQVSYSYTTTFYKSDTLINLNPDLVI
jgi:hypothetical protein